MIVTAHWSASGPHPLGDYHVEFYANSAVPVALNSALGKTSDPKAVNWEVLKKLFAVVKNTPFTEVTSYGTWHMNSDPRDGSANVEVGALCMGGESVTVAGPWGAYPYTYAHSWMHAAIIARICKIKGVDPLERFNSGSFMNGPIFGVSTHAERALQTPDQPAATLRPNFGYFIYSGDSDCRWDIAVRDVSEAEKLTDPNTARQCAIDNASWIRKAAAAIISAGITDMWGLDK